ncbi:hypothetical protein Hanom_Chr05g00445861 [Helianthus anomalus]
MCCRRHHNHHRLHQHHHMPLPPPSSQSAFANPIFSLSLLPQTIIFTNLVFDPLFRQSSWLLLHGGGWWRRRHCFWGL